MLGLLNRGFLFLWTMISMNNRFEIVTYDEWMDWTALQAYSSKSSMPPGLPNLPTEHVKADNRSYERDIFGRVQPPMMRYSNEWISMSLRECGRQASQVFRARC